MIADSTECIQEVPDENKKPLYTYASLNAAGQKATLYDIYSWVQDQFLYYKNWETPFVTTLA